MNLCASGRFEPYHAATQESDLEAAVSCLQSKLSRGVHGLKEVRPPRPLNLSAVSWLLTIVTSRQRKRRGVARTPISS
jgi:hypothetical protein